MKFCPICGNPTNDKLYCDNCGYTKDEDREEFLNTKLQTTEIKKIDHIVPLDEIKKMKVETGKLNSISYITSGGMQGSYYSTSLDFDKKEITKISKEWHHATKITKTYNVLEEDLKNIEEKIEKNNLAAWSQIGEDKSLIAFDAPTSNMYINYKNSSYTIPFLIYMDENERNIFFNIRDEVFNLEKEENLIKTEETEKNDINNIMMGMIYDNNLKN